MIIDDVSVEIVVHVRLRVVGRLALPVNRFSTGNSTLRVRVLGHSKYLEYVGRDNHLDTRNRRDSGGTVLFSARSSGPNLMQSENCELFARYF